MKKILLMILLLCGTCYAGPMSSGGIQDPLAVEHGGTGAQLASNARINLDVYSTDEVDALVAAGQLLYYTTGSPSANVAGMRRFATSTEDLALLTEWASDTEAINDNGVYHLIASYITPVGFPGITALRQGIYSAHSHCYRLSGNRELKLEIELWLYDSAGSPKTFVATSSEEMIPSTNDGFAITFSVPAAVACDVTDRLVWRVYVESLSGSNATVVRTYTGNSKTTYFGVPVSNEQVCTVATPQTLSNKTFSGETILATATISHLSGLTVVEAYQGSQDLYAVASSALATFSAEDIDTLGEFTPATGEFVAATSKTVEVSGRFPIAMIVNGPQTDSGVFVYIFKNGVQYSRDQLYFPAPAAGSTYYVPSILLGPRAIPLIAGDALTVRVEISGTNISGCVTVNGRDFHITIKQVR